MKRIHTSVFSPIHGATISGLWPLTLAAIAMMVCAALFISRMLSDPSGWPLWISGFAVLSYTGFAVLDVRRRLAATQRRYHQRLQERTKRLRDITEEICKTQTTHL